MVSQTTVEAFQPLWASLPSMTSCPRMWGSVPTCPPPQAAPEGFKEGGDVPPGALPGSDDRGPSFLAVCPNDPLTLRFQVGVRAGGGGVPKKERRGSGRLAQR